MKKIVILILLIIPIRVYAINASSYVVMDTDNNRVLEGNNIHNKSLIASITKIMTSMVVINNCDISKEIEVGNEVLESFGSGIYITPGEKISYENLLYGLMLRSGNDAAITLASHVGGSMEGFATLMNSLAKSIGMKDTIFYNSSGLEDKHGENISTVYDMGLLSSYAIHNETYKKIVGTKNISIKTNLKSYIWHNKNRLLTTYPYCTGGKTGFTEKARRTLVTNASKGNVNLTVVTFNDGSDFEDHKSLYNKYFNSLRKYRILQKGKIETKYANTYINETFEIALSEKEYQKLDVKINYLNDNVTDIIGYVSVDLNGKNYFKTNIYQSKKDFVEEKSLWQILKEKIISLFD